MLTKTPHHRQEQILAWLQTERSIAIDTLAERLDVSAMTIHRDLDQLVKAGQVQKVYGAAELVEARQGQKLTCDLCKMDVLDRTLFTLQLKNGEKRHACCPHCGLLLLENSDSFALALTPDFIYGRMVNVMQGFYVVESRVHFCCVPSVLCFTCSEDAKSFQRGFGGEVVNFENLMSQLSQHHSHPQGK
jgi:hypothetical protein